MNRLTMLTFAVVSMFMATVSIARASMKVWMDTGLNPGADKWKFKFSTPQRCFTFGNCLNGVTIGAEWEDVDDANAIVFYSQDECQGKKLVSKSVPKGQVLFDYGSTSIGANSFVVWDQGIYATRGLAKECLERAVVNGTSSSS